MLNKSSTPVLVIDFLGKDHDHLLPLLNKHGAVHSGVFADGYPAYTLPVKDSRDGERVVQALIEADPHGLVNAHLIEQERTLWFYHTAGRLWMYLGWLLEMSKERAQATGTCITAGTFHFGSVCRG